MTFADREPLPHRCPYGPYSMMGPAKVRGAEPGDAIECPVPAPRTIDGCWNSFLLVAGALPADVKEPYLYYFSIDAECSATESCASSTADPPSTSP